MLEIASARLFAGLAREEIQSVLSASIRRRFKASETIIQAESPGTHLFLVRMGHADFFIVTENGHRILLRRMVPGNAFGIAAFLSEPVGYLGTATAVGDAELFSWERRELRQLARAHPRLSENALRIALNYIAMYARRHISLVSDSAQDRLAHVLSGLASKGGRVMPTGMEVDIKNDDLASLADVSFFTASRIMKKWACAGAVEKSRGKVLVRCPEKLLAGEPDAPDERAWSKERRARQVV